MNKDDFNLLYDAILKLDSRYESIQNEISKLKSDLYTFIETSNLKEKGYQDRADYFQRRMDDYEKKLEVLKSLEEKMKQKEAEELGLQKGKDRIATWANVFKWIVTTALALFGLVAWGKK